ncbi:MAG TPA: GNAT family N-acetyltransferase [Steroidobacteraceae bacterium]
MKLQPFDLAFLPELMAWFPDAHATTVWGGPGFRFPFTAATFREDARIDGLATRALIDNHGHFVGFGQFYERVGRCHLGRLAIAPAMRGHGFGTQLVRSLCIEGGKVLGADTFSLFVLPGNEKALSLYQRLGFAPATYPEPSPLFADCVYMVASRLP